MPLGNETCFAAWAPDESPWSAWVKPVLFTRLDVHGITDRPRALDPAVAARLPAQAAGTAIVVDLPGDASIRAGLELMRRGWRPVPLFNATTGDRALVDVKPICDLLRFGAEDLGQERLAGDAPPAFLIDDRRMLGTPGPGAYDNRSMVMPQDFPSANFMRARGITEVLVIQMRTRPPGEDLAHVLLRWKEGGLALRFLELSEGTSGELDVKPPSRFRKAWYRVLTLMKLKRDNVGGFGGIVPVPGSGGYG